MISKTFFKSSLIYSFVGALPYVSGVILIPFFTSQLTSQQFGVNALYYSMMVVFQVLAGFGMDSFIGIYYYEYKDDARRLKELIGTILFFSLTIGTFLVVFFSFTGPIAFHLLWPRIGNLDFFPLGLFTLLTAIFSALFKCYTSLLIHQQRVERFFWMSILNFTLTIGVSLLLLYAFPYTLTGPILGRLIPMSLSFILCLYLMSNEFGFKVRMDLLKPVLNFCGPIFIYSFLLWIVNYIDRFVIPYFIPDTSYVGVFDIAVKITLFIDIFQMGLMNTINPKILSIWKDRDLKESSVEVNRYYNGFTALTLLIIPLLLIVIPIFLPMVIKKPIYYQALVYLPILSLGFVTRGWFYMFMTPLYFFKKTRALPKVFLLSAIFQIVSSILLIKYFGIMGAVWASFIVKPVQAIFLYNESRKIFHFRFNRWKILYLPIIFILVGLVCETLATDSTRVILQSGQFILTAGLVLLVYRNELIPLVRQWLRV